MAAADRDKNASSSRAVKAEGLIEGNPMVIFQAKMGDKLFS